jgi:ribosomal protein RSM22 (predicted rRNA methylase)
VKNDDPEYADVEPPDDPNDMIDPYGVTKDKNTRSADVRHKEAPSGDLYAVSGKQTTKTDDDINKNKDGINPEELYAKPNKKRNQKSKMSKASEEKEATKSGTAVDSETPSNDEKSSGSKHTEHFETEAGDVYAKVTK